ncbi:hypothetical protein F2P81_004184 [Scophthalmus maximus]|uniref:Uncharacterized protein n=1 Tax=Scophthalmus maximus TaxID=52904 RepID=A0A6A4T920_SCOMX|nr:hypothetical protein F2P81_004184 [Scophthalmus maximus]
MWSDDYYCGQYRDNDIINACPQWKPRKLHLDSSLVATGAVEDEQTARTEDEAVTMRVCVWQIAVAVRLIAQRCYGFSAALVEATLVLRKRVCGRPTIDPS